MPESEPLCSLRDLTMLYLYMAHCAGDDQADEELEVVKERLHQRNLTLDYNTVQDVFLESLRSYEKVDDAKKRTLHAIERLNRCLSNEQKEVVVSDLRDIAGVDGVLLQSDRELLACVADQWEIELKPVHIEQPIPILVNEDEDWGVLHDLALIYLYLAHGIDNELSRGEVLVILKKLKEWQPTFTESKVGTVLNTALECYANGHDEERLSMSITSVRDNLPRAKRMMVLNDLIQIANADGVFLDDEEDMINRLKTAWDVDAYVGYGSHGSNVKF